MESSKKSEKSYKAYMRVSTYKQKQDETIENQEYLLSNWLKYNENDNEKIKIDEIIKDEISGVKDRPKLINAIDEIIAKNLDGLIVTSLSRFSRSMLQTLILSKKLEDNHKDLIILDLKIDTRTPQGRFAFNSFANFYEFDRNQVIDRLQLGRKRRFDENVAKYGKSLFGRPPIEIPEKEIKEMMKLYRAGVGFQRIAENYRDKSTGEYKFGKKDSIRKALIKAGIKPRPINNIKNE